jgi:5-methylthioribose kinase
MAEFDSAFYKEEKTKFTNMMDAFKEEAVASLREEFSQHVSHLADVLRKDKRFYDSSVEHVVDFIDKFAKLNIANDKELAAQVEAVRRVLGGAGPAAIRTSEGLKEKVALGMVDVEKELNKLIIDKPRRAFFFD